MTKQTCKRLLGTLFFFGILALTFWYVFRDENLGKVLDYLTDADIRYVLPAMAAVVGFILGESLAMSQLLHPLGAKPKFYRCCLISFVGFFYSAITPCLRRPAHAAIVHASGRCPGSGVHGGAGHHHHRL